MLDKLIQLDKTLFLWLNSHNSPVWDKIMWFISGKLEWVPLYLLIIGYIIFRYRWKSIPIITSIILLIALADRFSVMAFKQVFERLRPSHNVDFQGIIHLYMRDNGSYYTGGLYGFVSSHAANSFALATFLALLFRSRILSVGLFIWAGLVAYSRIYLGVHYPADIAGGALLGSILAWGIFLFYKFISSRIYPEK